MPYTIRGWESKNVFHNLDFEQNRRRMAISLKEWFFIAHITRPGIDILCVHILSFSCRTRSTLFLASIGQNTKE